MKRNLIVVGDKTTADGVVQNGMSAGFNNGTPLAYHGSRVYCPACKSEGYVAAWGPSWPMSFDGKQVALENDLCICQCNPPPRLVASHDDMSQTFEAHELAALGYAADGSSVAEMESENRAFDRYFRFVDENGAPVTGIRVHVTDASGSTSPVTTDGDGRTPVVSGNEGQEIGVKLIKSEAP
jgi:uncharacterized Zn-binding protein involved in type VI secretion